MGLRSGDESGAMGPQETYALLRRAQDAEAEVAKLTGALLDVEHDVHTAESPRDMFDAVVSRVESVLGKPPRPYAPKLPGEPAVRVRE